MREGQPGLFRRYLWYLTPSKNTTIIPVTESLEVCEPRPSIYLNMAGHALLGLLYVLIIFGYCGFLLYSWVMRPSTDTFSMLSTTSFAPLPLLVEVSCTNYPNCGNFSVISNYSTTPTCGAAGGVIDVSTESAAPLSKNVSLCAIGTTQLFDPMGRGPVSIQGIVVEFSAINPGVDKSVVPSGVPDPTLAAQGVVSVYTRTTPNADPQLIAIVNVDSWQIKTLLIEQRVTRQDSVVSSTTAYSGGIQYDGHRPNWRSSLIIQLMPLTQVRDISKPGWLSIMGVLGSCATANWIGTLLFLPLIPLIEHVFPSAATKEARKAEEQVQHQKEGTDAILLADI